MNMKCAVIIALALSPYLLAACDGTTSVSSTNRGLPTEVERAALSYIPTVRSSKWWEDKDFKVACFDEVKITAADKANGLEQKWCVDVAFVSRERPDEFHPQQKPWADARLSVNVYREQGNWKAGAWWGQHGAVCTCRLLEQ